MTYRYQEWSDGIHNFNDHILLSLHLCVFLKNPVQVSHNHKLFVLLFSFVQCYIYIYFFQNSTAVSRIMEILDATECGPFPKHEVVLQAYLHFEALTDLDYHYSCVSCGNYPSVVIMDLHKKGAFSMPGMFIH